MEDFFFSLLSNYVFPIALSVYLLVRVEKTVKENTQAINELKEEIKRKKDY